MLRLGLRASLALLLVSALIVAAGVVADFGRRSDAPEAVARRYFAALESGDGPTALEAIAPEARPSAGSFVAQSLNNEYRVTGVAVRQPSILDRLRGSPGQPQELTIFIDITEWGTGARWQAGPRVPLVQIEGRWYLARAPLEP
ncbi:MAG: hypothetical protein HW416_3311 [Chloroflexi bacterium]|nr:hypothetical protein [Chloroflexota bacterium]